MLTCSNYFENKTYSLTTSEKKELGLCVLFAVNFKKKYNEIKIKT